MSSARKRQPIKDAPSVTCAKQDTIRESKINHSHRVKIQWEIHPHLVCGAACLSGDCLGSWSDVAANDNSPLACSGLAYRKLSFHCCFCYKNGRVNKDIKTGEGMV